MLSQYRAKLSLLLLPLLTIACLSTDGELSGDCELSNPANVGSGGLFDIENFGLVFLETPTFSSSLNSLSVAGSTINPNFLDIVLYKKHPTLRHIGFHLEYRPSIGPAVVTKTTNANSIFFVDPAVSTPAGMQTWIKEYNSDYNDDPNDIYPKVLILTEQDDFLTGVEIILNFRETNEQRACVTSFNFSR